MNSASNEIKKQTIRYIIYLIFVLGLTALAFYLTVGNSMNQIIDTLSKANAWSILIILLIVFLCIIFRSTAIFFITRIYEKDYYFHRSIAIDQVGTLYRMVTPAGLGGHVMETYTYNKQGVRVSTALSVLAIYSIIYQVVLILYGLVTIIIKRDLVNEIRYISISFSSNGNASVSLWLLIAIGFTFNVLSIGFILLISYWNGFYRFVRGPITKGLNKVKIVKDLEKAQLQLDDAVVNFRSNLKIMLKNIPVVVTCMILFFLYITFSYSVPYFCGLSLGNTSSYANFWDSVLLSNFHQMVTCIIPIPGSSVISELFFLRLFYQSSGPSFYSSEEIARASLLLWRSLMFIFPLIIACLYTVIYHPRKRNLDENQIDQNPQE